MSQPRLHQKRSSASVLSLPKKSLGLRPQRTPECLPPSFLRAARSVQPVPLEGTHSVCTPAARREAEDQMDLTLAKPTEKADEP